MPLRVGLNVLHHHRDPPQPIALLLARCERPRSRTAEYRDELAPFHHSITSAAATCSVKGTVRPSAFAVFRLITVSNLIGT